MRIRWGLPIRALAAAAGVAAVSGCALLQTAAPAPAPAAAPAPSTLQAVTVKGPLHNSDLAALAASFAGQPDDAATHARLDALLRAYYGWYEWNIVQVRIPSSADAAGVLAAEVSATAPEPVAPPPAPAVAPAPAKSAPVPAHRRWGKSTRRSENEIDPALDAWRQSASRVLVDARNHRLYLKETPTQLVSFEVAVGQPSRQTPAGLYAVEAVTPNPTWYPPDSLRKHMETKGHVLPVSVPPGEKNPLGSWFVQLQHGYGIHGTNQPDSIGRSVSWGCIRMQEEDVHELAKFVRRGDRVMVIEAAADLARLAVRAAEGSSS